MSILSTIKDVMLVRIHPKGKPIIIGIAIATVIGYLLSDILGNLLLLATLFSLYFFRDPARMVPQNEGLVLASGDGVISDIREATLPVELGIETEEPYTRISIFLNVFNVHVNRVPVTGSVLREIYIPGKFFNAALDKASTENERSVAAIKTAGGDVIGFSQIAGLVARRIVCQLYEGDTPRQGERYGIIRFGSRCDVYVPSRYRIMVDKGSVSVGGETILAMDTDNFDADSLHWQQR